MQAVAYATTTTERTIARLLQAEGFAATKVSDISVPPFGRCRTPEFEAMPFSSKWGAQARTFDWTELELFIECRTNQRPITRVWRAWIARG
jgi:hypothetical protein